MTRFFVTYVPIIVRRRSFRFWGGLGDAEDGAGPSPVLVLGGERPRWRK